MGKVVPAQNGERDKVKVREGEEKVTVKCETAQKEEVKITSKSTCPLFPIRKYIL